MKSIKTMIVEDDFKVAEINKSFTEEVRSFVVEKIAKNAVEALSYLEKSSVDLIVLDIYLPDMHGTELLKIIRKKEFAADIILITAAHDAETVECSMRYGIFDYIVKPFAFSRFKDALEKYRDYKHSLNENRNYNQEKINEFVAYNQHSDSGNKLPKGITQYTLDRIVEAVDSLNPSFSIEDVISRVSFSKITVRRYLEYLHEKGLISKSFEYQKVGRPLVVYSSHK
ncbi:response regulator [Marispirochaeta sp.]|jgi:response regulator of citrate/malate metabolism|uniref:response regulator n=1 Tax=Marispirochaeta sp. TaxID=2038653 RepID=UPI0029C7F3B2|nr:response regulator [Marispirochaeta sp.]